MVIKFVTTVKLISTPANATLHLWEVLKVRLKLGAAALHGTPKNCPGTRVE